MKKNDKNQPKAIFLTWHLYNYGLAYLKHILASFHRGDLKVNEVGNFKTPELDQEELQNYWDNPQSKGYCFEKIYIIVPSPKIFSKRMTPQSFRVNTLRLDEKLKNYGLLEAWEQLYQNSNMTLRDLNQDLNQLKKILPKDKFDLAQQELWRNIQHYKPQDQVEWLTQQSNILKVYSKNTFECLNFDETKDPDNYSELGAFLQKTILDLRKKHPDNHFVVQTVLSNAENHALFMLAAEIGLLPENKTNLISCYDLKEKSKTGLQRFYPFQIKVIPPMIFKSIIKKWQDIDFGLSKNRRITQIKLKHYLEMGFSILLLGERGTGKTHTINKILNEKHDGQSIAIQANCASFEDDSKAESILFGHAKGAFTGADRETEGLFQAAHKSTTNVLFLDEIHHLSKRVQAKLLTSLSTNQENEFHIQKLGSTKTERIKVKLVFASNKSLEELRTLLYPDFFDRIAQLVVEFPSLRDCPEDRREDWALIWKQLRFEELGSPLPKSINFIQWLKSLNLYGNYRDLQKIAIYYQSFQTLSEAGKALLGFKSAEDFAKDQFNRYANAEKTTRPLSEALNFSAGPKQAQQQFKRLFYDWVNNEFGSVKKATEYFQARGDNTTDRTLHSWGSDKKDKKNEEDD